MSLQHRLILSYLLIILLTFLVAMLTIITIARPVQRQVNQTQLAAQIEKVSTLLDTTGRGGDPIKRFDRLDDWAHRNRVQLILVTRQGDVLREVGRGRAPTALTDQKGVPLQIQPDSQFTINDPLWERELTLRTLSVLGQMQGQEVIVGIIAGSVPNLLPFIIGLGWGAVPAMATAILLALLFSTLIAHSIARPLQEIEQATVTVAQGDYEHRLDTHGPREIQHVAESFNVMIERVEDNEQAMRDFVSNVSHELKTPLTSIRGFAQAIKDGAASSETARQQAATIIYDESNRMTRLVEDFLDLARLDSGQMTLNKHPLDLGQLLSGTVSRLTPQAEAKGIQLKADFGTIGRRLLVEHVETELPHLPTIQGDGDRLVQVFTNLLDNAVRYTPSGGQVMLRASVKQPVQPPTRSSIFRLGGLTSATSKSVAPLNPVVEITIADTGPGIPAEDVSRIFERFYQVDKSRQRGHGSGIGLAIVKEIVEGHHGTVSAESVVGVGSTFTVRLPAS